MTEPIEKDDKSILTSIDEFYENQIKIHSGKISIGLSILGGITSILAGKLILATSIVAGITNISVFFSSIMLERLNSQNKNISEENKSLINDKKELIHRLTTYQFPNSNMPTPSNDTNISEISTQTKYEELKAFNLKN